MPVLKWSWSALSVAGWVAQRERERVREIERERGRERVWSCVCVRLKPKTQCRYWSDPDLLSVLQVELLREKERDRKRERESTPSLLGPDYLIPREVWLKSLSHHTPSGCSCPHCETGTGINLSALPQSISAITKAPHTDTLQIVWVGRGQFLIATSLNIRVKIFNQG